MAEARSKLSAVEDTLARTEEELVGARSQLHCMQVTMILLAHLVGIENLVENFNFGSFLFHVLDFVCSRANTLVDWHLNGHRVCRYVVKEITKEHTACRVFEEC